MAEPGAVEPAGEVKPEKATEGKTPEDIQNAVNKRLASCDPVKIGDEEFDIKVSLEKKAATSGGKRNRRKTRSKRSARKSHKSRRVFGGKRK